MVRPTKVAEVEADIYRSSVQLARIKPLALWIWIPRIREEDSGCTGRKQAASVRHGKLLDYSRRTTGRAAVSRHQTEFVGFGIKVISFATSRSAYPRWPGVGKPRPIIARYYCPTKSFRKCNQYRSKVVSNVCRCVPYLRDKVIREMSPTADL